MKPKHIAFMNKIDNIWKSRSITNYDKLPGKTINKIVRSKQDSSIIYLKFKNGTHFCTSDLECLDLEYTAHLEEKVFILENTQLIEEYAEVKKAYQEEIKQHEIQKRYQLYLELKEEFGSLFENEQTTN